MKSLAREFTFAGVAGEVVPFIKDMSAAFADADIVVGRSGAGGVNEIAAAGMASILVPLPFAADDHQKENAKTLVDAAAARMVLDPDMNGARLFREVSDLYGKAGAARRHAPKSTSVCPSRRRRARRRSTGGSGPEQAPPTKLRVFI